MIPWRNLPGGERIFIRGVVAQHGPVKDKRGVRESFAKVTFFSRRMVVLGKKIFDQPSNIYIYMAVDLKVLRRSFNSESRAYYVGNPRVFFASSRKNFSRERLSAGFFQ